MKKILLITIGLIYTIASIVLLIYTDFSLTLLAAALFFGICTLIFIFQDKINDRIAERHKKKMDAAKCVIKDDHIYFPKGYEFNYGILKDKNKLPFDLIDEIRYNTFPISAKVNGNEIVFLKGILKGDLPLIQKANIPITQPQDNWELICEEFLDTEFDDEVEQRTLQLLEQSGISVEEVKKIRKKLESRMLAQTFITWEWVYYGQYDVLYAIQPLNETEYWWTMNIALREKNNE